MSVARLTEVGKNLWRAMNPDSVKLATFQKGVKAFCMKQKASLEDIQFKGEEMLDNGESAWIIVYHGFEYAILKADGFWMSHTKNEG